MSRARVPWPCPPRGTRSSPRTTTREHGRQGKDTCDGAVSLGSLVAGDDGEVHASDAVEEGVWGRR